MPYTAIKPFTYLGREIARGGAWEPTGHRNDAQIIRARLVVETNVDPKLQRAAAHASAPAARKAGK